jgi:hypothetical protein
VSLPLRLAPGETRLLAFGPRPRSGLHLTATDAERARVVGDRLLVEDSRAGTHGATLSDGRKLTLAVPSLPDPIRPGRWDLTVTEVGPGGPVDHKLQLDSLQDWRDLGEISSASGTGVYTTHVIVPPDWLSESRGVRLNIGKAGGALELFLNGKRVTWQDTPDVQVPVDDLVHEGDNELQVVVTTNRINKMVALSRSDPDPYYRLWSARSTQPYGLLGPVELRPVARTAVVLPPLRRRCASRRRFGITLRVPAGFRPRSGVMRIGRTTRRVKVRVRGRRVRAVVDLRGRPVGTVRVRLTLRGGRGRVRHAVRAYRLCRKR